MEHQVGCSLVLALAVIFLTAAVDAKFIVEKHSLSITSPESIKGTYESAIANFGVPQYGGSMAGTVVYPEKDSMGCKPFSSGGGHQFKAGAGGRPTIVLVDRGECYFTSKVLNAQQAGAAAVLVGDDRDENLITMDAPESPMAEDPKEMNVTEITIPAALVRKNTSDAMKKALAAGQMVNVNLDWREALPHPDESVEYEFWTNSNDECGAKCDAQAQFVANFKGIAQTMRNYTQFTPHYITWYCPQAYVESKQCLSQCINNGRYCAPDPEQDFEIGYDGKDVVVENLRQLCVWRLGNETGNPGVWWEYVTDFKARCKMADKNYNAECAEKVIAALGLEVRKVRDCVGDPTKDVENLVLKEEQEAQVGTGTRGDVTILPTLVINQRQYRGKLDVNAVLKAICSGFLEGTDPPQCLGTEIQTNDCENNNGGCWSGFGTTACKDTFRGKICECPMDAKTGVTFIGDGYTDCTPSGPGRCLVNNGNCWSFTRGDVVFSACQEGVAGTGCKCPAGFSGNGFTCEDIDECAPGSSICKCPECRCKNTIGSYECSCSGGSMYIKEHDKCISNVGSSSDSNVGWITAGSVLAGLAVFGVIAYVIYKYRIRSYMDSEIRAIMAQYMPLDSQTEPIRQADEA